MNTSGDAFYGTNQGAASMSLPADQLLGNPLPCGDCGSDDVRVKVRQGKAGIGAAYVRCNACTASGPLCMGKEARSEAVEAWARHPPLRQQDRAEPGRAVTGDTRAAERDRERDPLELIARMVVGGSYRIPTEGRSTSVPLSAADVAGAVGMMTDPVAKQTALAVALRAEGHQLVQLGRTALRRVLRQYLHAGERSPLQMDSPADRWRARLVLQDAVHDLVWPERRRSSHEAARAVKMRKSAYLAAYRIAAGTLQQALEDGRLQFKTRLFGGR